MAEIDARGLRCPWPAIRLAKAMREQSDAALVIMADDPAAAGELQRVAVAAGAGFERLDATRFLVRR